MSATSSAMAYVQLMYIAYYGRAADVEGLAYWSERAMEEGLSRIANAFGTSAEFQENYAALGNDQLVEGLYQQLLGRSADVQGLRFYVEGLQRGDFTLPDIALRIIDGVRADTADFAVMVNRLQVAQYATEAGASDSAIATIIESVLADRSSVVEALQALSDALGTGDDYNPFNLSVGGAGQTLTVSATASAVGGTSPLQAIGMDGVSFDGSGVSVVVLDTGIDSDNTAFGADADGSGVADRIRFAGDFSGEGDNSANDEYGHGTVIASIIGAEAGAYPGVAPGADIIALQVLRGDGQGSAASVELALEWISEHRSAFNIAAVVMPFTDGGNYDLGDSNPGYLSDEIDALESLGIVVVAAAGNNYADPTIQDAAEQDGAAYPAADPRIIGVGSTFSQDYGAYAWLNGAVANTTGADRIAPFSQRDADLANVFAPGVEIPGATPGGSASITGTSASAALVAGVAAVAQQAAQAQLGRMLTPDEFRGLLRDASVSAAITDNDDEDDNVAATGETYYRIDVPGILAAIGDGRFEPAPDNPDTAPGNTGTDATVGIGGDGVSGTIDSPTDEDWYRVELEPGQTYELTLVGEGGFTNPEIALHDGNGVRVDVSGPVNGVAVLIVTVPETGPTPYYVVAKPAPGGGGGAGTGGPFVVTVNPVDAIPGSLETEASLPVSSGVSSTIDFEGDDDWFAVSLDEGISYSISLTATAPDTALRLLIPTPGAPGGVTEVTGIDFQGFVPDTPGVYYVSVSGETEGDYDVVLLSNLEVDAIADRASMAADGGSLTGNVLNNDLRGDEPAAVVAVQGQAALVGTTLTAASGASLTLNSNGSYLYVAPASGVSAVVVDQFTYTLSDVNGDRDSTTLTITVNPVNSAPVARDDSVLTDFETAIDINVLANDSDPDGDTLSILSAGDPGNGTVVTADGAGLRYLPGAGFSGVDRFSYTISDGEGGTDTATVSITVGATPDAARFSVADATVTEGEAAVITISRSGDSSAPASVTVATAPPEPGTDSASTDDFSALAATVVNFGAGQTTAQLSIPTAADALVEDAETFRVLLSNPSSGATIEDGSAVVTIIDATSPPSAELSISGPTQVDEAVGNVTYTLTLSEALPDTLSVDLSAVDGTATAGEDYLALGSTLSFAPGTTELTVSLAVIDDILDEPDEDFSVVLSNLVGDARLVTATQQTTIVDDDEPAPTVSIAGPSEVDEAQDTATYTVSLSAASATTVSVDVSSFDGLATAGVDYTGIDATLTFAPGETEQTITVALIDDDLDEPDEDFTVALGNLVGTAELGTSEQQTIIADDDGASALVSVSGPLEIVEGAGSVTYTVELSEALGSETSVDFLTVAGDALAGEDYSAVTSTLIFAPGQTAQTVSVSILDDTIQELSERFSVQLANAVGDLDIGVGEQETTILDDDGAAIVSVADITIDESAGTIALTLTREGDASAPGSVAYAINDDTATADEDYSGTLAGTVTFAANESVKFISLTIIDDALIESDEQFTVSLFDPVNLIIAGGEGVVTIIDNDAPPDDAVNGVTVAAGDAGNSFTNAADAPFVADEVSITGSAGFGSDGGDFYRLVAPDDGYFTLDLTGLGDDLNLVLLNANGGILRSSANLGTSAERIAYPVVAGATYFAGIQPAVGVTDAESAYAALVAFVPGSPNDFINGQDIVDAGSSLSTRAPVTFFDDGSAVIEGAIGSPLEPSAQLDQLDRYSFVAHTTGSYIVDVFDLFGTGASPTIETVFYDGEQAIGSIDGSGGGVVDLFAGQRIDFTIGDAGLAEPANYIVDILGPDPLVGSGDVLNGADVGDQVNSLIDPEFPVSGDFVAEGTVGFAATLRDSGLIGFDDGDSWGTTGLNDGGTFVLQVAPTSFDSEVAIWAISDLGFASGAFFDASNGITIEGSFVPVSSLDFTVIQVTEANRGQPGSQGAYSLEYSDSPGPAPSDIVNGVNIYDAGLFDAEIGGGYAPPAVPGAFPLTPGQSASITGVVGGVLLLPTLELSYADVDLIDSYTYSAETAELLTVDFIALDPQNDHALELIVRTAFQGQIYAGVGSAVDSIDVSLEEGDRLFIDVRPAEEQTTEFLLSEYALDIIGLGASSSVPEDVLG